MPDRPYSSTGTADHTDPPSGAAAGAVTATPASSDSGPRSGDGSGDGGEGRPRAALDRKGGPGHTMLVAVLLAVPVVKIAFTVGGAGPARAVLTSLGVKGLPAVLVAMVLDSPWLGCVLGVVVSRALLAFFAARGVVPHSRDRRALARATAMLLINPVAVGVLAACLYGWTWGLATGLVSAGLRQGLIIEYRTGRRHRHRHESGHADENDHGRSWSPSSRHRAARRFAAVEQALAAALVIGVLPAVGLASALDGHSWAPLLDCTLDVPHSSARAPMIEFTRDGTGVVGWDVDAHEVLNGHSCTQAPSQEVRPAWWNG